MPNTGLLIVSLIHVCCVEALTRRFCMNRIQVLALAGMIIFGVSCSGGGGGSAPQVTPPPTPVVTPPYLSWSQSQYDCIVPSTGTYYSAVVTLSLTLYPGSTPFSYTPSVTFTDDFLHLTYQKSVQPGAAGSYVYLVVFETNRNGSLTAPIRTGLATVTATYNYNGQPIKAYCTVYAHR
jgi:hypothetical protein